MTREIEAFIKDFVSDLSENNVAIFAGAGMSISLGFVDWKELMSEIAHDLGLEIDREYDLVSLAQYHVNEKSRVKLTKKIIEEYTERAEISESHRILARLPISTYWTTNYDKVIEQALEESNKIVDVKFLVEQIFDTRPKRDAVLYKMHGDVSLPSKTTLTKEEYESYHVTHEPFISALRGDLTTKTFLFIGFSFTDPNLDYVLSRIRVTHGKPRDHYCFVRKPKLGEKGSEDQAAFEYNTRKQSLMIGELRRYGIQPLLIDEYSQIEQVLGEIEKRFRKKTIFISGSAEEYAKWSRAEAQEFIHKLSKKIVTSNFRIVNGFGWGIGSAVINGALEAVYERPDKFSEQQLVMKPFPQYSTGGKGVKELWEEYRQKMIRLAGVAIFIFGNKLDDAGQVIPANGVEREFEIALEHGLIPIPVGVTGSVAKTIYDRISTDFELYYKGNEWIIPIVRDLGTNEDLSSSEIIGRVMEIVTKVNK